MRPIPLAPAVLLAATLISAFVMLSLFPFSKARRPARLPEIVLPDNSESDSASNSVRNKLRARPAGVSRKEINQAVFLVSRADTKTILRIAGVLEQSGFATSRDVVEIALSELGGEGISDAMKTELSRHFRAEDVRKSLRYLHSDSAASSLGIAVFKSLLVRRLSEYQ